MRVTEGVRKIIVEWHGKGVPPEETARSLRIPIDEVKATVPKVLSFLNSMMPATTWAAPP